MSTKHYLGNPLIKSAGVQIKFTQTQVAEYVKCAADPVYFIEQYVKIVHVDHGLIPFKLYPHQHKLIKSFSDNRFVIGKLSRQSGKSVLVSAYILWLILFKDNKSAEILANKGALAREMLAKIKMAYEYLPLWLQQGVKIWNKGNIELENGSKVLAAATSSSAVRGGSYSLVFLDEFAFIHQNIAEQFFASVYPTISSGKTTRVIIVSTPNGMNHFYKMWEDAIHERSLYVPVEAHWSDVPGRDEMWRLETIKNTSEEQFRQEFGTEFIGSSHTLISMHKLKSLAFRDPLLLSGAGVKIYQKPEPGHVYVLVADAAHGVGIDYSAFSIIDITKAPWHQVAVYKNNTVETSVYPEIMAKAAKFFNDAYILGESNDVGRQILDVLGSELEYENLLLTIQTPKGQKLTGGCRGSVSGVKMTKAVKKVGCANVKDLIESDQLQLIDFDTISELTCFVRKKDSYEAEEPNHDDLAMGLVLFGWLSGQAYFKDLTDTNIRQQLAARKAEEILFGLEPDVVCDDHGASGEPREFDVDGALWISVPG